MENKGDGSIFKNIVEVNNKMQTKLKIKCDLKSPGVNQVTEPQTNFLNVAIEESVAKQKVVGLQMEEV